MEEREVLDAVGWPSRHSRQLGSIAWVANNYDAMDPAQAWDATQARVVRESSVIELRAVSIGRSGESNSLARIRFESDPREGHSWRVTASEIGDPPLRVLPSMALDLIDSMRPELEPEGRFRPLSDRPEPSPWFDPI